MNSHVPLSVIMAFEVPETQIAGTMDLLLLQKMGLDSCRPLLTFLSVDQYVT